MNSHYDPNQPGQYKAPINPPATPPKPKSKMPLWAKIILGVLAVPVFLVGGCMAIVGGSLASETVKGAQADKTPVISTAAPRETPRAPKPVEVAPTKAKPTKTAPVLTMGQEQAIGAAEDYLNVSAFSRKGLIKQLSSAYGEGFSLADSTYAADHVTEEKVDADGKVTRVPVNWNEQAAKSAKSYLQVTHFSRAGLIQQLESEHGEGFTHAQAVYGVKKAGL